MRNSLAKINQTIWELKKKVEKNPESLMLRKELLRLFHESAVFIERKIGIPEQDRSFLMLQDREALCCLLIHGAGGSPKEMLPLGKHLFESGYTVYGIRLPLGGTPQEAHKNNRSKASLPWKKRAANSAACSWSSCMSACEITLETLIDYSRNSYVIGFSFGATIAINLLRRYPVRGGVLISPALVPTSTVRSVLFRTIRKVAPSVARRLAPVEDTIIDLMEKTRANTSPVEQPVLVLQAKDDPVLSMKGFEQLKRRASNPRSSFVGLEKGGHVLVDAELGPQVFSACSDFIKEI